MFSYVSSNQNHAAWKIIAFVVIKTAGTFKFIMKVRILL